MSKARQNFNQAANDNAPDPDAMLLMAAENGDLAEVKKWLGKGANINARDRFQNTPLHLSAKEGHEDVVEHLLKEEADLTLINNFNRNALLESLREHQNDKIVLALIEAGSPLNGQDTHSNTAAYYAAQDDRPVVMTALADKGADLTIASKGTTPLIHATKFQHTDVIRAMMGHNTALDHQDSSGMTALMHAASSNNLLLAGSYIAMKANVMLYNTDKKRASEIARERGHDAMAVMIEKAEAEILKPIQNGVSGVKRLKTAKFKPVT